MAFAVTPSIVVTGDCAVTVVFGHDLDLELNDQVLALDRSLVDDPIPGVLETVPGLATLLVRFHPSDIDRASLAELIEERLAGAAKSQDPEGQQRRWRIPAIYGGAHGPDLGSVADFLSLSEDEVIEAHASLQLRVLMLGFAPGFAYLGLADPMWDIPRLPEVTPQVPAGAILVAARQTALSATPIPTGWRQLARTPFRSFDPEAPDPFRLRPGDLVEFEPVTSAEYRRLAEAGENVATVEAVE